MVRSYLLSENTGCAYIYPDLAPTIMMGYSERHFPVRRPGCHLLVSRGFSVGGICQEIAAFCLYTILTRSILIGMSTNVDVDFSVAGTPDTSRETESECDCLQVSGRQWLVTTVVRDLLRVLSFDGKHGRIRVLSRLEPAGGAQHFQGVAGVGILSSGLN